MQEAFLDSSTREGQERVRRYVLGWLERLDYAGRLQRGWPPAEVAAALWERIEHDFGHHWSGPVVSNRALAEVVATTVVEDYYGAYPERRASRYTVSGPFGDHSFRRCVLDFLHDIEEFGPAELVGDAAESATAFWREVRESPQRWEYTPARGAFVDDEVRARHVVHETIREYHTLRAQVEEGRAG